VLRARDKSFLVLFFKKELLCFLALLALGACGGDEPPPDENYAPLHYEFLRQLRLNVGSVDVVDHSAPPGPGDVSAQDPVSPDQVFNQLARDRLVAAGTAGRAVFTVDAATITQGDGGALNGVLAGHLAVFSDAGQQVADAEARVSRQHVPGSEPENLRNNLYDMTRQMMDDMNVELEFQIRRSMRSWLVSNTAVPAPVTAGPLAPATPAVPVPAAPEPAAPPANASPYESTPLQMSPPPGFLQPPATVAPPAQAVPPTQVYPPADAYPPSDQPPAPDQPAAPEQPPRYQPPSSQPPTTGEPI
jgi:hypothetical protein